MGKYKKRIVVTGGAGFIGSNLLLTLVPRYPEYFFVNVDKLTYAGNLANLKEIENAENYRFEKVDIRDFNALSAIYEKYDIGSVMHLAAESHVDRSIIGPADFIQTNIIGTFNLLELYRARFKKDASTFLHISTDEVYGSLGEGGYFTEYSAYRPNSPYSASKASADHLVRAYHNTYGLHPVITNCSNNFGPYQFPEKLIPLMIRNACEGKKLPVYGDGKHVRDWLYVEDHCEALDLVFHEGEPGQTYNIGAHNEIENIELVRLICGIMDEMLGGGPREALIEFVPDRPGHDRRYAIDSTRIIKELGWRPQVSFEEGLRKTVQWYLDNRAWLDNCINGEYVKYYEQNYTDRQS
ncbi:MAG: dTDP-glucose 4,6-dehydratase [candidate division Zixibacteria bacterium]|nr:dTDP-glucose 4,6-dehydratase [candidate division Zixibacteria bacterium]